MSFYKKTYIIIDFSLWYLNIYLYILQTKNLFYFFKRCFVDHVKLFMAWLNYSTPQVCFKYMHIIVKLKFSFLFFFSFKNMKKSETWFWIELNFLRFGLVNPPPFSQPSFLFNIPIFWFGWLRESLLVDFSFGEFFFFIIADENLYVFKISFKSLLDK